MFKLYPAFCGPLLAAWCANAAPVPPINVPRLMQDSDIIVAGTYGETVVQAGALTRPHIRVDDIVKGTPHLDLGGIKLKLLENKYILPPRSGLFFLNASDVEVKFPESYLPIPPSQFRTTPKRPGMLEEIAADISYR